MSKIYDKRATPQIINLRAAERNSLEYLATKHFQTTMASSFRFIMSWVYINDASVSMQEITKIKEFKY